MPLAFRLIEAANPAGSGVIRAMPAEDVMHLVDQAQGKLLILVLLRLTIQLQEVTDRESIRPQVAPWWLPIHKPGQMGKLGHEFPDYLPGCILFHRISLKRPDKTDRPILFRQFPSRKPAGPTR